MLTPKKVDATSDLEQSLNEFFTRSSDTYSYRVIIEKWKDFVSIDIVGWALEIHKNCLQISSSYADLVCTCYCVFFCSFFVQSWTDNILYDCACYNTHNVSFALSRMKHFIYTPVIGSSVFKRNYSRVHLWFHPRTILFETHRLM